MQQLTAPHELVRRPRRLRRTATLRTLTRETRLTPERFIYPLFVRAGRGVREPIGPMPGQFRLSVDLLAGEAAELRRLGIRAVLLFGIPERKDALGSGAYDPDGIVPQAIRALRDADPELVVAADVCLCEYTTHGHCGVIRDGQVDNDATLELLAQTATALAAAGADVVAPSAMMDGQVGAIRRALDAAGQQQVAVMAYSAKYASVFYGPFREAAGSAPQFGDRRGYQMDPPNVREALREITLDVEEGADLVMVKPALAYLDVIRAAREIVPVPLAAYNVSGEYAMVKAAAERGWLDGPAAALEILTAIARAGADVIITYFAKEAARLIA
ncbi:MAG: porphobilinogen synthase [Armatimonadota bacterium]|nr:porphobilinogen synthase [Armatimonadota bacterium]MDR7427343.1 porphobilinogen synthase [Armatimonadota bacterium]MDR7464704.1 porphobilinogen synthase [Armatimonadota bacterium]MDR7468689.1 porphobilinogen synthase [Armatimonadota bacterium]MDR7538196.1 porphobilinogen synthase [Armatimonadota bacterium]